MVDRSVFEDIERRVRSLNLPASKDYLNFIRTEIESKERQSIYEKACNFSEKIFRIRMGIETERKFDSAIRFCYFNITPSGPVSLVTLLFLILSPIFILLTILGILSLTATIVSFIVLVAISYYFYNYPFFKSRIIRSQASTELVLTVLYMAIALREVPNLEAATVFASQNLSGVISYDLKRVIWKIYTQQYSTVQQALDEFIEKWRKENEEFAESIKLLMASIQQPPDRALKMVDESIDLILARTEERMNHYAQGLRLPVMAIYAIGIILPIITLVIFPIVMIFLQEFFNITFLIVLYDVILPITLFWFINNTLKTKPPTTSQPEIKGKITDITLFNKSFSVLLIALPLLIIPTLILGNSLFQYHRLFSACDTWRSAKFDPTFIPEGFRITESYCKDLLIDTSMPILYSSLITLVIAFSIGISCFLATRNKMKIREKVTILEREFSIALFQLGHQITAGNPLESALEKAKQNLKNMEMANFYDRILSNIKILGSTLEGAIFNREYGAVWDYPSDLIKSIMRIIVEGARKSLYAASVSMLTISKYLKNMHTVDEKIKEMMSETVTSMKFLALFLSPLVAGITVAMAIIVLNIISILSFQLVTIGGEGGIEVPTAGSFLLGLWKGGAAVTPDVFQLVLGIFIIESSILLGIFINGIENGEDRIGELHLIGILLIVSVSVYTITSFIVNSIFGNLMGSLLFGIGG
jgi:hypothetical protein